MLDFAAIDFETANEQRSSICSVGLVVVRNGLITKKVHRLIKPEPDYYNYWNTRIHGLTAQDTDNEPVFSEVWSELTPLIAEYPLIAHNSPFDEGCLKAAFKTYGMDYPDYAFYCTCRTARKVLKGLPNYQLQTVSAACGFELLNHHDALADAEACAAIALQIF